MTDEQKARRVAEVAWDVQPSFRHRFKNVQELTERILAGRHHTQHTGFFLPLCILETYCSVDAMRTTLAHADLDEVNGESTVHPDLVARARNVLSELEPVMPTFESFCGDWVHGE